MNSNDKLEQAVEAAAKAIYDRLPLTQGLTEKPKWVENGNSLKQDDARIYARAAILAADAILHPPVEGELAEVYEDSTGARFIHQTRNEQLPPAGTKLYAAPPADKQDWEDAAMYAMFRALVDAGGAETVARYGAERDQDKFRYAILRGMLAIERKFHPERFDDEFTKPAAPATSEPDEAVGIVHNGNLVWKIDAHAPDGSLLYVRPQTELAQAAPSAQDRR